MLNSPPTISLGADIKVLLYTMYDVREGCPSAGDRFRIPDSVIVKGSPNITGLIYS